MKPLKVPASYASAAGIIEKVIFALAAITKGTAYDVIKRMQRLEPPTRDKRLIADIQQTLADLYQNGLISGNEDNGNLFYSIPGC